MTLKKVFAVTVSVATILITSKSVAQYRDHDRRDDRDSSARIERLERTVVDLSQRLARLERSGGAHGRGYVCSVTDRLKGQTHAGEGRNRVEAEAKARQVCSNFVNSMFCDSAAACEQF